MPTPRLAYSYRPPESPPLSPDGRWLAVLEEGSRTDAPHRQRVVFTDLRRGRSWLADVGRSTENWHWVSMYWSPDSRSCAIGSASGWRIARPQERPQERRARLIARAEDPGAAAWAPDSKRLALFEDEGGPMRIWNGRTLSRGRNWIASTGYREPHEAHIWQAVWSPDQSSILMRFYGHAERGPDLAGHTFVLSPRTGRTQFGWAAGARPTAWISASRLAYVDDEDDMGGPGNLMVDQPRSRSRNAWLRGVVAWTVSADREVLWALKSNGDLLRSPSSLKSWQVARRLGPGYWPAIAASPRGDLLALWDAIGGRGLSLISTSPAHPWVARWAPTGGTVQVLGWAQGLSLPLLMWQPAPDAPAKIIQLKW